MFTACLDLNLSLSYLQGQS